MFIKFRKKYLLPIKWWFKRRREIDNVLMRSREEIYDRLKVEEEKFYLLDRKSRTNEASEQKGKIIILKWLIYGESKNESNR